MHQSINSLVAVDKVSDIDSEEEVNSVLSGMLNHFKPIIKVPKNATIVIKVNLCLLIGPETGGTVDPRIARVLCKWLLEQYEINKIYLAEADATHLDADVAFKALGWARITDELKTVEFLNLSKDTPIEVNKQDAKYLKRLKMSKTLMDADLLISIAKLKTHTQQKITCIMKNQFGSIPYKYKIIYHPKLAEAIYDATAARTPDLCIIDGLIAMEGNGPTNGIPRKTKLLLASNDPVSMDHYCAKLMGFKPMSVPHLKLAITRSLGSTDYEILGNSPRPLDFKFLPKWKEVLKKAISLMQRTATNEEA